MYLLGEPWCLFFLILCHYEDYNIFIDMIYKEVNMVGNVFGTRRNFIGLISIDEYHIVFKSGGLNLAALEYFTYILSNVVTYIFER